MSIEIYKEYETADSVGYVFKSLVKTGTKESKDFGRMNVLEPKIGYCQFNKKTEAFELDRERTDPDFLQENSRVVLKVHMKLLQCKRQDLGYTDNLSIYF